jgi:hypothetical protein
MKTKFTEGEWSASQIKINGKAVDGTWSVGLNGFLIADVTSGPTFGVVNDIQKANAHLIAAAPNMYAMLEAIAINMHKTNSGSIQDILTIESLLAKARGESNE